MFRSFSRSFFLGMAVLLIVAACGGGSDDSGGAGDTSGTTATTSAGAAATVPTVISDIPGFSDECEALANLVLAATQVFTGATGNVDEMFAAAEAGVPRDLRGDVDTIRVAVEGFRDAMDELGVNPFQDPTAFANLTEEQIEVFEEMSGLLDSNDVDDAFDRISDWGESECDGFAPGG